MNFGKRPSRIGFGSAPRGRIDRSGVPRRGPAAATAAAARSGRNPRCAPLRSPPPSLPQDRLPGGFERQSGQNPRTAQAIAAKPVDARSIEAGRQHQPPLFGFGNSVAKCGNRPGAIGSRESAITRGRPSRLPPARVATTMLASQGRHGTNPAGRLSSPIVVLTLAAGPSVSRKGSLGPHRGPLTV